MRERERGSKRREREVDQGREEVHRLMCLLSFFIIFNPRLLFYW